MTNEGIKKCLGALSGAYPNMYKSMSPNDWLLMKETWSIQFKNADDLLVFSALQDAISTSEFPPSIATIKKNMMPQDNVNEEQIWSLLLRAGSNGNYGSQDEWDKLPKDLQDITTPGTIKEIARADDNSLQFIKRDILKSYKDHKANQNNLQLTSSTEIKMIGDKR